MFTITVTIQYVWFTITTAVHQLRVIPLGNTVTYNNVIIGMASKFTFYAELYHVISSFNIRESFIITVGACFW